MARDRERPDADGDEDPEAIDAVIPLDWGTKLRACLSCSLVKTVNQFLVQGCENCEFLKMVGDRERVMACTSSAILGIYSLIQPKFSWVASWQRTVKYRPGCYALAIDAVLPEDIAEEVSEMGARLGRTRATSYGASQY